MNLNEFYQKMLQIPAPWIVKRVEMSESPSRIDVYVEHEKSTFKCAKCGELCSVYDHTEERVWRHLHTCQYQTYLHARLPRTSCKDHGIQQIDSPFSEPGSKLTWLMEKWTITVLQQCNRSGGAILTELSWDQVDAVMERAVTRGLARRESEKKPEKIGIDEKSVFKGYNFCTIITDLDKRCVIDVIDKRTKNVIEPWLIERKEQFSEVKKVAMDMSASYASIIKTALPHAQIYFDHFHVTKLVNEALNDVRKEEQQSTTKIDKKTMFQSRYFFLRNVENIPEDKLNSFEKLRKSAKKTSRAWAIKENFRELWKCSNLEETEAFFTKWYYWATHSRLKPIVNAAKSIKKHWAGISRAVVEKITNACTEGLNNKIEKIKREACGFRNKEKLRIAILFYCGKLDVSL